MVLQSGGGESGGALLFGGIVLVVLFILLTSGSSSSRNIQRDELSDLDGWDSTEDLFPKENIKRLVVAIEDRNQKLRRIVKDNAVQYDNPETSQRVAQIEIDPNYRVELKVRTEENRMATITDKKIHKNTDEGDVEYNTKVINDRMDILPEKEQEASE